MKRMAMVMLAAIVLASAVPDAQEPERLFKAAMNAELVDGNLRSAIEQYRKVAESGPRPLAVQALLRMAECYQKLGDAQAASIYQRIVRDYADQSSSVATARLRLAATSPSVGPAVTLKSLPRSDGLAGSVSPDGRFLSFSSYSDGELYVRDLQTGTDRAVTQRGDFSIGLSSMSPDGARVAYQAYGRSCDGNLDSPGHPALCLVSLVGPRPASKVVLQSEEIREIVPMDWSPDGRTIAVSLRREDRTAQIGLVTVESGSLRVLQSVDWRGPTRIFFSPDGRDLAFDLPVNDASDDRDIAVLAVDGSRRLTAVEHPSQNVVMGWAPDGSALLFASDRGGTMSLWSQPFSERRPLGAPRLVRGGIGGAWSVGVTRGGELYFGVTNSERDISVTTADLSAGTQLAPPARPIRRFVGSNSMPDWSSDGKSLAYVSLRGFNPTNNAGRLIGVREMSTGEERELRPRLLYFGPVSWAPNGAALVTAGTDLKGRSGVFTIDARTGEATLVVEGTINGYPQWSADGKRVFYRKGAQGQSADWTIVERDLATGAERAIVRGEIGVFSLSPDGRSIAAPLGGLRGAAAAAIVEIRVDNGEMRDLLRAAASERFAPYVAPQWTPDGRAVLVRKRNPSELWLVPTTGASPRKVDVDVREWSFGAVGQISIHPDGRRIAFLSGDMSNEVMVLENFLPPAGAKP